MTKEKVQTQHAQEPNLTPLIRTKRRKALSTPAANTISWLATIGTGKDVSTRAQTMSTLQRQVGNNKAGHSLKAPIQAKLKVGAPNDKYEQEADSVARQVTAGGPTANDDMAQTKPQIQRMTGQDDEEKATMQVDAPAVDEEAVQMQADEAAPMEDEESGTIHRQAEASVAEDADEDQVSQMATDEQAPTDDEEGIDLQTKSQSNDGGSAVSPEVESSIHHARGGGQRLPKSVQAAMGNKFGADFSGVNIHTDGRADQLNRSLGARAFTTGQDIFFKRGQYDPGNSGGRELLAHELTHVVQQGGAKVQTKPVHHQKLRNTSTQVVQRDWLESIGNVASSIGKGIYSVGEDLVGGAARTVRGLNLSDTEELVRIGGENSRALDLLENIIRRRDTLKRIVSFAIEDIYNKLPTSRQAQIRDALTGQAIKAGSYIVGRVAIGSQLAALLARRIAARIATTQVYKMVAKKIAVSAGASATGVGIPIGLLMMQGVLERASRASRRLKQQNPELYRILSGYQLDMGWFLIEPHVNMIRQRINSLTSSK